jgi:hypothetical protein
MGAFEGGTMAETEHPTGWIVFDAWKLISPAGDCSCQGQFFDGDLKRQNHP